MSLFTKWERSLIFSSSKKSIFLELMLLLNFPIRRNLNILNSFNMSMISNKCIIRWFSIDVTTRSHFYDMFNVYLVLLSKKCLGEKGCMSKVGHVAAASISFQAPNQWDKTCQRSWSRERIIVPLDRHFVVYTGGAGVDEGASVDEGDVCRYPSTRTWLKGNQSCHNSDQSYV